MIDFWSSEIIIGYYEYKGVDDCVLTGDEQSYSAQTLLQTKYKPENNGTCSYTFYIQNSDANGFSFTLDIYRNVASMMAVSVFSVAALVAS